MKNILTLLLLIQCLFVVCSHAQTKSETPSSLTPYKVAPRFKDSLAMALPFKSIELWDRRFDTSKLGYLKKDFAFRKITTDGNTETVLQAHLNDTYKNNLQQSSAYDLLLVVKHL